MRAALAIALALPAAAPAQDAQLEVPVRVARAPAAASVGSVTCAAFADPTGPTSGLGYLGSGSRWFALANGGFAGRITVPVKFDAGTGPARAYRCALYFIFNPTAAEHRPAFRAATGARLVYEVTGAF
jgi:hypothetical protein